MERVKVFYTYNGDNDVEKDINKWLDSMGDKIDITRTMQNAYGSYKDNHLIITIFYKMK